MLPLPTLEVFAGLLVLFLLSLPLGALLIRGGERFVGHRWAFTVPERVLVAFYASGGLLFLCASLPVPIYGLPLVSAVLALGLVGYVALSIHERGSGVRSLVRYLGTWPALLLGVGSLALLALEVTSGMVLLPNGVDGTVDSLFVNLILQNHTLPWTLAPYSSDGVLYPQGAPVWMTVPVLVFGWPIVSSPVTLPPLFLGLSAAAAFCLGERIAGGGRGGTPWMGLLFAGFFGLLASWPRLYVAGSYDFIFAFPLFLVALGLLVPFAAKPHRSYREAIAFGVLTGTLAALSAATATTLILLTLFYLLAARPGLRQRLSSAVGDFAIVTGVTALFLARSFIGLTLWFNDPGHVVVDAGSPPYALPAHAQLYTGPVGQLDPFVPWKAKISPIPYLSVELQVLLVAGIVLAVALTARRARRWTTYLPPSLVRWAVLGTLVLLVETGGLLFLGSLNTSVSGIESVTNVWETSFLLFTFYELLMILPLVAAANYLLRRPTVRPVPPREPPAVPNRGSLDRHRVGSPAAGWRQALVVLVVLVPLATGFVATVEDVPGYLHSSIVAQANATQGDLAALQWAGAHLPDCSRVLVPPGSAAQFLPEFARVKLVFPVYPSPINLSYQTVVSDLTQGVYDNGTRRALLQLNVTEVFATGQTTNAWPPFQLDALRSSADFGILFTQQDALIVAFVPGVTATGCSPR